MKQETKPKKEIMQESKKEERRRQTPQARKHENASTTNSWP
jgi:hypothetical protein